MTTSKKILFEDADPLLTFSARVMGEWTASRGIPCQSHPIAVASVREVAEIPEKADALRLSLLKSVDWLPGCPVVPMKVSLYGAADVFYFSRNAWTADLLLEKSLHQTLIHEAHHVDIRESAYVIGGGPLLRVVAGVVAGLGFRKIYLVGEDGADLEEQSQILKRIFMGMEIVTLPVHSLTLQTVGASLLVNTLNLAERAELSADLAYFNFMKKGGLVLDLNDLTGRHPVLEEANRAGLRVIAAASVYGGRDLLLMKALSMNLAGREADYLAFFLEQAELASSGEGASPST